jgi:hypothetical protein
VKESGRIGDINDEDEFKGAGTGISFYADQHGQSDVDVQELRPVEEGGRTGGINDEDEFEGAGTEASFYSDQHD